MPPLEILALIPLSLLLAYGLWHLRIFSIRKQLRQPLRDVPLPLVAAWFETAPDSKRARWGSDAADEGIENPGLSCIEVLFQLSRLDRNQLLDWQPERVPEEFQQLLEALQPSEADPDALAQQEFAKAHLGEQMLAEQLRQQGHDVQLQPITKQQAEDAPGWRASVDGYPVQLIASPQSDDIQTFIDQSGDIPAVTLADHREAFIDHAMVLALDQVTAAQLSPNALVRAEPATESTEVVAVEVPQPKRPTDEAMAALSNVGNMVMARTANPLLLTAYRSAQLAAAGDRDWLSAAKHGLTDQAGSAVGGWAGARAGALAGGLLGPLGAAAGGWLGGLLGKKVGEGVASQQKQKKLKKLLARQDKFLSQLPEVARAALQHQAKHLLAAASQLAPPSEASVWPGPGLIARRQVAAQYKAWSKQVQSRADNLQKWLKNKPSSSRLAARGRKLLERGSLGWSPELLELRAELLFLASQIDEEQERLQRLQQLEAN